MQAMDPRWVSGPRLTVTAVTSPAQHLVLLTARTGDDRLLHPGGGLVEAALEQLGPNSYATAIELAQLPEAIRGYEEIKLANLRAAEQRAEALLRDLRAPRQSERIELEVV